MATTPCGGAGTTAAPRLVAHTPGLTPLLPVVRACVYGGRVQANKQAIAHLAEASRARCKAS
jgi:hypothetical protein